MTDTNSRTGGGSEPSPRLHVPIQLRWGDLDAYNHVNNATMLKLLEEARIRAFWKTNDSATSYPTALYDANASSTMMLIARQEIEYLRPVPYQQDPLDVQIWFGHLGGSSADVCFEIHSPIGAAAPTLYARSVATVVMVSAETGRPVRLPETMRSSWQPYLGEPIHTRRR